LHAEYSIFARPGISEKLLPYPDDSPGNLVARQVVIAVLAAVFLIVGLIRIPIAILGSDQQTLFRFADAGFYQQFL